MYGDLMLVYNQLDKCMISNISSWNSHGILLFAIRYIVSFPNFFSCLLSSVSRVFFPCWYYWKVTEHILSKITGKVVWRFCFWRFLCFSQDQLHHYGQSYPYWVVTFVYHPCRCWGFFVFLLYLDFDYESSVHMGKWNVRTDTIYEERILWFSPLSLSLSL